MKPFDFQYGRKQEIDSEKEEKEILMGESEDEDFGSFQQKMEKIIYLESYMAGFSINMLDLINNVGGTRMKAHYSYVFGIQGVVGGELDMTGLRTTILFWW
ncbi:hypothetical protein AVEN_26775-1 [Araneus ventricosus]|uniref:Uncharacterized protein n=1 Tax=Araneus ventricosus TaxID=182803 RepID=A0A4Y2D6E6_ARAVE|nr:hypothetical protein AVEN_26775-1 [Araneus ventricosus]